MKPQSMPEALAQVKALTAPETTVVSIAAGVRLSTLEGAFPSGQAIVRAMPNTPAQIGMSMTVAVANANVTEARRTVVDRLFAAIGARAWIDDEGLLDAVTAVSGSGPAYVFLLAECMAEAGRAAGLPPDLAARLARWTVAGAGELLHRSELGADVLRQNVTSPGGTTAAALYELERGGLRTVLSDAIWAAYRRSAELGKGK